MGRPANYRVENVTIDITGALVIRDIGPWDKHLTVTNDAEGVVDELLKMGTLKPGQRLFYIDSECVLDEILVKDGKFARFCPGPGRRI